MMAEKVVRKLPTLFVVLCLKEPGVPVDILEVVREGETIWNLYGTEPKREIMTALSYEHLMWKLRNAVLQGLYELVESA